MATLQQALANADQLTARSLVGDYREVVNCPAFKALVRRLQKLETKTRRDWTRLAACLMAKREAARIKRAIARRR